MVASYASFIKWKYEDRAAALRELKELCEAIRMWQEPHPDLIDDSTGDPAVRSISELLSSIMATCFGPDVNNTP